MIIGVGIDIVEVPRIRKAVLKWEGSFLRRIFTNREMMFSNKDASSMQHLAARFAAKEAVLKAFGGNDKKNVEWTDMEILNEKSGRPKVRLHGAMRNIQRRARVSDIMISLSHTPTYAMACVVLLGK